MKPKRPEIRVGQVWRDKDRRREQSTCVRQFTVLAIPDEYGWVLCAGSQDREYRFRKRRFGSGAANDSFELVKDVDNG